MADRYLDLLSLCLTRSMDEPLGRVPHNETTPWKRLRTAAYETANDMLGKAGLALAETNMGQRETMISREALENIRSCIETAVNGHIPGDFIECGVWRGGASIFARACLEIYDRDRERRVWCADSFEGLPKPDSRYAADATDVHWKQGLSVGGVDTVKTNFAKYGFCDRVEYLVGWFKDTLPTAPIEKLAVMRLDGDMYESTWQCLEALYPKLSPGGFCIVDDYVCVPGCKQAVDDYRARHGIEEPMVKVDWTVHFWRKES